MSDKTEYFKSPFIKNSVYPWILSLGVITFFALLALYFSYKKDKIDTNKADPDDFFFSARESQPLWKITWSIFASCMGLWVLYAIPSSVVYFGIVGVISYSISAGFPIVLLAMNGNLLRRKFKGVTNFTDYISLRYGLIPKIVISLLMIFNMAAGLASEYNMMAKFFKSILCLPEIFFVILIGIVTMAYTAFGGLTVSILTDQIQGIFSLALIVVFIIFSWINIDSSSIKDYSGELENEKFASLFYFPLSMFCATIFNEALWQRVWASTDSKSLTKASIISSILVGLVILLSGIGGILAYCINSEDIDKRSSTLLFELVLTEKDGVSYTIGVIISILAITMNISAVDSLQNGFISALYSFLLKDQPLLYSRLAVIAINIPAIYVGLLGHGLLDIYCVSNLVATSFTFPILAGLFDLSNDHISGLGATIGGIGSLLSLGFYIVFRYTTDTDPGIDFTTRFYTAASFAIALGASFIFLGLWILIEKLYLKQNSQELRVYGFNTCKDYISSRLAHKEILDTSIHTDEKDSS